MTNFSGSVTVNGINDKELVKILEIKIQHEGKFNFNPQQLQIAQRSGHPSPEAVYNNAVFSWSSESGLEAVYKVMGYLLKKEEHLKAA